MEPEQEYDQRVNSKIHYLNFNKKSPQESDNSSVSSSTKSYAGILSEVSALKPSLPVYFIRPNSLKKAAGFFLKNFVSSKYKTDILYAVKSNPDKSVLQHLFDSGIRNFDVASITEIKLIHSLFGFEAKMHFMHPVKSREAIYEAYFNYKIRDFALDSSDELTKILQVTENAKDLGLHVRLAIPNSHAAMDLSGKFGILPSEAVSLVRKTRSAAKNFGICFHVGSQCMDPIEYRNALLIAKEVLDHAKVKADIIDVGGGFPSSYPAMTPPNLFSYFDEIFDTLNSLNLDENCRIWCEPGRALVAEAGSLLVRVEAKKKSMLYLNDGTYGGLFDAGFPGFIYPVRAIRIKNSQPFVTKEVPFGFYGPTCDSLDSMKGPFYLPENIAEGDYIEIGQLGAYSRSIRTQFNGFDQNLQIEVADEPLVSMYNFEDKEQQEAEISAS